MLGLPLSFHGLHVLPHLHGFEFLASLARFLVACVGFGCIFGLLNLILVEMVGVALKNHVGVQNNSMQAACR